jgi:uncharacterized protein
MTALVTGFLIGVAGSWHCAGMCGPLLLSMGPRSASRLVLYHAGRLSIYVLLAVPIGLVGHLISLRGLGKVVAVAGAAILLAAAAGAGRMRIWDRAGRTATAVAARACAAAARWRRTRPIAGSVAAGAAHGLLPCGLVYAAVAASAGMASLTGAAATMLGFGLGTLPVLIAVSVSAARLPASLHPYMRRLTPAVFVLAAVLLLARAFDLPMPLHVAATHHG